MGVGKAALCNHGPSSIVSSENGPCCRTIAYFVGGEREEDLVYSHMSPSLSIWEKYLVVFVCPEIYFEMCFGNTLATRHEIYHAGNYFKKSWTPGICVRPTSWKWA